VGGTSIYSRISQEKVEKYALRREVVILPDDEVIRILSSIGTYRC